MKRWSELGRRKQEDKRIGRGQEGREVELFTSCCSHGATVHSQC